MLIWFISFILLISSTGCQEFDTQDYINLLKNNQTIQNFYMPHLNHFVQFIDYVLDDAERKISSQCANDLNHLKIGLLRTNEFALRFYEANAKDSAGILSGSDGDLGKFEQCLSIKAVNGRQGYIGKYCLVSVQTRLSDTIKMKKVYQQNQVGLSDEGRLSVEMNTGTIFGLCVPNSCNLENLLDSVNKKTKAYNITVVGQPDRYCSSNDLSHNNEPFKNSEIICLSIVATFAALCLLACYIENRFLNFFSITKNLKKIYRVPENYDQNIYNFIHGFKAVYIILSVGGHACGILYLFAPFLYATMRNYSDIKNPFIKSIVKRLLIGPEIAVFMGGFLAIVAWNIWFRQGRASFVFYVVKRFVRTFPIIISMLLLDRIWPRLLGSGPYFRQITDHLQRNCDRSFWKVFLFVSNNDRALDICQLPSWFISVDFQLYIAHYWTIKYLIQKPKFGLCLAFFQIIGMSIYSALNVYLNDLEPYYNSLNVYFYNTIRFEQQYFVSSIHSNSYTIGVLTGCLVLNNKKLTFFDSKFNRFLTLFLSILSVNLSIFLPELVFGEHSYLPKDNVAVSIALSAWSSIYRSFSLLLFLCIFYYMALGYLKSARTILSHRIMVPLSRLSFTIIMSQFVYLWYNIGTRKKHFLTTPIDLMKEVTLSLVISLIIGILVFAFLEAPIQNLLLNITGLGKMECRLSGDMQKQILKDQANKLPSINKPPKNHSTNVFLGENTNQKLTEIRLC